MSMSIFLDGDLRKIDRPKKKKIKHLSFTNILAEDIRSTILSDGKISNSKIRKFLQVEDINRGGLITLMSKDDIIEMQGVVLETLPNAISKLN